MSQNIKAGILPLSVYILFMEMSIRAPSSLELLKTILPQAGWHDKPVRESRSLGSLSGPPTSAPCDRDRNEKQGFGAAKLQIMKPITGYTCMSKSVRNRNRMEKRIFFSTKY